MTKIFMIGSMICCFLSSISICNAQESSVDDEKILPWDNKDLLVDIPETVSFKPSGENGSIITFSVKERPPYEDRETPLTRGISVFPTKGNSWDISQFATISFDVENLDNDRQCALLFRFNANWKATLGMAVLRPGEKQKISYDIYHQGPLEMGFGLCAFPQGFVGKMNVDTSAIRSIQICCHGKPQNRIKLTNISVSGKYSPSQSIRSENQFFPFVDQYGQNKHKNWTVKIRQNSDLKKNLELEKSSLKQRIPGWNKYGGLANGPKFKTNGFFRAEKYKGKWYLIDPDGCLFFSKGVNAVDIGKPFKITDSIRRCFPENVTYGKTKLSFQQDNIKIKYGTDWKLYFNFINKRFDSWGVNTIGNWSNNLLYKSRKHPYTLELTLPYGACPSISRMLPDVYSKKFRDWAKDPYVFPQWGLDKSFAKNDPWCIGFFVGNESHFGNETHIAELTLRCDASQPAKIELINVLKHKYRDIKNLNQSWGTKYKSWQELISSTDLPDMKKAYHDFADFSRTYVSEFFRLCRDGVKRHSPDNLFLGHRFTIYDAFQPYLGELAAKYFDVLSYNLYLMSFDRFVPAGIGDKPYIVTESTIGHKARGMFATCCNAGNMSNARSQALLRQYEGILNNPKIVGHHHFCYRDQPITSRWMDSENQCFGIVDCADTPYSDFTRTMRSISIQLYNFRLNKTINDDLQ